jgi:hypothetical protein
VNDSCGAGRDLTAGQALRVAWYRARAFSLVSRVPVAGLLVAPWLWPMQLAVVAGQGDQIRHHASASMTVNDGGTRQVHPPTMGIAAAAVLAQAAVLLTAAVGLAVAFAPIVSPTAAALSGVLIAFSPILLELITTTVIRLIRDRESFTLTRRRTELATTGPALMMSSFVRSPRENARGDGKLLLAIMKAQWQAQHTAVVFHPANQALVRYYTREGAVTDDGARSRMKYDYRRRTRSEHAPDLPGVTAGVPAT